MTLQSLKAAFGMAALRYGHLPFPYLLDLGSTAAAAAAGQWNSTLPQLLRNA
jgi:hypothetical protein